MNIGVFTHHDEVMAPVAAITVPVLQKYCDRHGYELTVATERLSDRRIVWDKIPLLQLNLSRFNWVWYVDCDILITNHYVKLEDILSQVPPDIDCYLATDINGPNLGSFFVRNTEWSDALLNATWLQGELPETTSEQHGLINALKGMALLAGGRGGYASQNRFNSYPYELYGHPQTTPGNWRPGSFLVHLPGMTTERRVELFTEYAKEIVW